MAVDTADFGRQSIISIDNIVSMCYWELSNRQPWSFARTPMRYPVEFDEIEAASRARRKSAPVDGRGSRRRSPDIGAPRAVLPPAKRRF